MDNIVSMFFVMEKIQNNDKNIVLVTMLIKQDFYAQLCLIISKKIQQLVFCFTTDKSKEKKDLELIHIFAEREKN